MNSADNVLRIIEQLKKHGGDLSAAIWETALACEGWPYVFGAEGEECTPERRKRRARSDHPTIVTKCQALNNGAGCDGCKWLPGGERVLMFDCQGYTEWCLGQFGINIKAAGATSQWNNKKFWRAQGTIDSVPDDILVCLFQADGNKKCHTGFGYRGETLECQVGVQHFPKRNKKWTHWAIPVGLDGDIPDYRPTLRKGAKGEYVKQLQEQLMSLGYELPKYGADGDYGAETIAAVKAFQTDNGLTADGICGPKTWNELKAPEPPKPVKLYTATIPNLTEEEVAALKTIYPAAAVTEST